MARKNRILERIALTGVYLCTGSSLFAEETLERLEALELPPLVVMDQRVAEGRPVSSFPMPVSVLRYEPRVDLQRRGSAEAQSDLSVRGSTFEAVGFRVGASPLFDPQTGHYFAEIPIAPAMLTRPEVRTGAENSRTGFNATTATVAYGWEPIETRGRLEARGGQNNLFGGSLYQGYALPGDNVWGTWGIDGEISFLETDGAREHGDASLERYNIRAQGQTDLGQTDIFAGYQAKFFGWPNLYTPFSDRETENLQTTFLALNHRHEGLNGGYLEAGLSFRHNKDEYQFNRDQPTDMFQHATRVVAAGWEGREEGSRFFVEHAATVVADDLTSNSLNSGNFNSRTYGQLALVPGVQGDWGESVVWRWSAGGVVEGSNRDGGRVSPQTRLELIQEQAEQEWVWHAEYAESARFPAYTTLNSAPAGLFAGNAGLGRELARQYETGVRWTTTRWAAETTFFLRQDRDLADWILRDGQLNARSAEAIDIDTWGLENYLFMPWEQGEWRLGYTYLEKDRRTSGEGIIGSFYALNYPRHRVTFGGEWQPLEQLSLQGDLEWRRQEENPLRIKGSRSPVMAVIGATFYPLVDRSLEVGVVVENVLGTDFEEVPGTPGIPRQAVLTAAYQW